MIGLDTPSLVTPDEADGAIERSVREALGSFEGGASVLLHAGPGSDDPRIQTTLERLARTFGRDPKAKAVDSIGEALGRVMEKVLSQSGLRRGATTGGDTSCYVAKELGAHALEAVAPIAPGSPRCPVHSNIRGADGCGIVFKGGQVGTRDFFGRMMQGLRIIMVTIRNGER